MELLCQDADPIFIPNVWEPLCILAVVHPIGNAEAVRPTTDTFMASFHHD